MSVKLDGDVLKGIWSTGNQIMEITEANQDGTFKGFMASIGTQFPITGRFDTNSHGHTLGFTLVLGDSSGTFDATAGIVAVVRSAPFLNMKCHYQTITGATGGISTGSYVMFKDTKLLDSILSKEHQHLLENGDSMFPVKNKDK